ncbi:Bgt-5476 [Blumeria graminis f. sp. tritici]|uniref:Bgt-5476 n=2 Tax=Blumeria graminis f. sp. tritici TaxID=62690 RepID=A0A061HKR0_BLUGR|nr:GPI-anchored cell surface glycoprotein [Blumeria graminis f. sp. tritici 96224]VCU41218.1 Bgt-5476 [Blumeria graminis f. sp. tritici]
MDQPPRANAAQLAARNIKNARGKHPRRPGQIPREKPTAQWAQPAGESGLFGGSIQATGTFDFAAPSSLKLNQPSMGGVTNSSSNSLDNPDGRFSGDDRNLKRLFGQSAAPTEHNFGAANVQKQPMETTFNFQSDVQPTKIGSDKNSTNVGFSFGSAPQPTPSSGNIFNSVAQSTPSSGNIFNSVPSGNNGNSIFSFNNLSSSQVAQNSSFQTESSTQHSQSRTAAFTFGNNSDQSTVPAGKNCFSFGGQQLGLAQNPIFSSGPNTVSTNMFGTIQNTQNSSANSKPTLNITPSLPGSSLFSSNLSDIKKTETPITSNLFSTSTSNLFGNQQEATIPLADNTSNQIFGTVGWISEKSKTTNQKPMSSNLMFQQPCAVSSATPSHTNLKNISSESTTQNPSSIFSYPNLKDTKVSEPDNQDRLTEIPSTNPPTTQKVDTQFSFLNRHEKTPNFSDKRNIFGSPSKDLDGAKNSEKISVFSQNTRKIWPHNTSHAQIDSGTIENADAHMTTKNTEIAEIRGTVSSTDVDSTLLKETPCKKFEVDLEPSNIFIRNSHENSITGDSKSTPQNIFEQATSLSPIPKNDSILTSPVGKSVPFVPDAYSPVKSQGISVVSKDSSKSAIPKGTQSALQIYDSRSELRLQNRFTPDSIPENPSFRNLALISQIKDEEIDKKIPPGTDDVSRQHFYASYRLRSLNQAMAKLFADLPISSDPQTALEFFIEERRIILTECSNKTHSKRKSNVESDEEENPSKKRKPNNADVSANSLAISEPVPIPSKPRTKRKLAEVEECEIKDSGKRNKESDQYAQPISNNLSHTSHDSCTSNLKSPSGDAFQQSNSLYPQMHTFPSPNSNYEKENENLSSPSDRDMRSNSISKEILHKTISIEKSATANLKESETANIFRDILENSSSSAEPKSNKQASGVSCNSQSEHSRISYPNPFSIVTSTPGESQASINYSTSIIPKQTPAISSSANNIDNGRPRFDLVPTSSNAFKSNLAMPVSSFIAQNSQISGRVSTDFLAQFKLKAKESEAQEMEKDKIEDMESDEDEAEWEARWKKKRDTRKLESGTNDKQKCATFVPGKGFVIQGLDATNSVASPHTEDKQSSEKLSTSDQPEVKDDSTHGINVSLNSSLKGCGSTRHEYLDNSSSPNTIKFSQEESKVDQELMKASPFCQSGQDGILISSKSNIEDKSYPKKETNTSLTNELKAGKNSASMESQTLLDQTDSKESSNESIISAAKTPAKSIFESTLATPNVNTNPFAPKDDNSQPVFNKKAVGFHNPFSISQNGASPSDNTWKIDNPIRFGSSPAGTCTPNTKNESPRSIIQTSAPSIFSLQNKSKTEPTLFSNSVIPSTKSFDSKDKQALAGSSETSRPSLFSAPTSEAGLTGAAFVFGQPSGSLSLTTSFNKPTEANQTSNVDTSNNDHQNNDNDDEKQEQIDLTVTGPGEENEEILHEVRVKALKFVSQSEKSGKGWETKGIGPLRVLRHQERGTCRLLLRGDPSGKVVLNKSILGNVNYENTGKTLKLLCASDTGKGLETWVLQLKTEEYAKELAAVLIKHKPV